MAITQYSRIQHRRGLIVDLPILEASELGHVVDERRLFIGNGEIVDGAPEVGNTEILTEFSPLLDIIEHTYISNTGVTAQTGPLPNDPVIRTLQSVLDDRLSIKSYGAVGDGIADDSEAINRALENVYTITIGVGAQEQAYRAIYFPAGEYLLDADQIYLPPYTVLFGDGPQQTIIRMIDTGKTSAIRTADSLFQNDLQLGDSGATLPIYIKCYNIGFVHDGDQNLISLDRASEVSFNNCKFGNAWAGGASTSTLIYIDPIGSVLEQKNFEFIGCLFEGGGYILNADVTGEDVHNIKFKDCHFKGFYRGIFADSDSADVVAGISVENCIFEDIEETALYANPYAARIVSSNNTYINCGDVSNPVIFFDSTVGFEANGCASVNDKFELSIGVISVRNLGKENLVLNPQTDFVFNNITYTPKLGAFTLQPGQTNTLTDIQYDVNEIDTAFIDYTVLRDGYARSGRLFLVSDGTLTGTNLADLNSESGPTGVTFDFDLSGTTLSIVYTTTAGSSGDFHYQTKTWSML